MASKFSNKTFKLRPLVAACALGSCLGMLSTGVLADGDIQGRVTDSSNKVYFEGALVEILELNQKQISQRDGSFRFAKLPSGSYTLKITYLGAPPVEYKLNIDNQDLLQRNFIIGNDNSALENIIVYGQKAGQAGALNRQKNAINLKSIVSSDAIGQFPDQNAAEALQRLPGLFVQRDQGEGRFVGIRGVDPNLNSVSINGANVPSPEGTIRGVAMDVIPSELIEGLEISKTVTPDMDADAIGGSIEVKSLTAFDREDNSYSITVQNSYNDQISQSSPKVSGSYTNIFELDNGHKLGLATAVSWFEREFGSHNIETDGGWFEIEAEDLNSGEEVEGFGSEEIEQRHYLITRKRMGAALNLDYHASATSKYYLRSLYSDFSDDEFRLRNEYKLNDGKIDASTWTPDNADYVEAEMDRDTKDRFEEQEILSIVGGGENQFDNWKMEYSLSYSKSKENQPNRIDADFAGEEIDMGYTSTGPAPSLYQSANAHDLSNFELDEIVFENNLTEDEEISFKIDLTREFKWNEHNGFFKFGAKHRDREKFNDVDVIVYDGGFGDVTANDFASANPDWSLGHFGPGLSQDLMRRFFHSNQAQFEINELDSSIESAGNSFRSTEDISAIYAMLGLDMDKWHIVGGLRFESSRYSTSGSRVEIIEDEVQDSASVVIRPWDVDKNYDYLLPSLNVRYDFSDKLLTRFAFSQTLARPTFGDSAAYQRTETEVTEEDGETITEREAEAGNPDLDPIESTNLDVSIEYYPGDIGVMSAGLFYKDIENFIVEAEVQDNPEWEGYKEVIQAINGGSSELTGVELAWAKTFDIGLLLSANATFTDSDNTLPNQADMVNNFSIGYEKDRISSRLTLSQKSKTFQLTDNDIDVYQDSHSQLDLSVKYQLNDNAQIYFNGINLRDEPYFLYHGNSNYNYQYETYGSTYEIGITWTSF